ncbi:uncharacterized protein [Trachinotus anak]|uniref:uncharacterized protein isoform X2 n=1 Tax=Trachinotus anak TaxID=443729 RepID=UPI0039F1876D
MMVPKKRKCSTVATGELHRVMELTIYTKMYKRLQNMRSPRKRQGSIPQRGAVKTALFSMDNRDMETDTDTRTDTSSSSDNTILLESNEDTSEDNSSAVPPSVPRKPKSGTKTSVLPPESASGSSPRTVIASPTTPANDVVVGQDSLKMQARHYRTLSNMYNKPNAKPNQNDVAQILDLEFEARRAFIDADVTREEDRPAKTFEAYPCLKDVRNAMDELRCIVGVTNSRYIEEVKGRWADFCARVQFYGVWKKVLKAPFPLDVCSVDFTLALFNALPSLFPSSTSPPKRLGNSCEALLHTLKSGEDPTLYLEKRPLSSPVLLFDGSTTIVAVGNVPVTTLPQEDFSEGMLVLMAYYYTHLTYPKCVATLLSVIQTEVMTPSTIKMPLVHTRKQWLIGNHSLISSIAKPVEK